MTSLPADSAEPAGRAAAIRFVVLLGIVSLFADMTYEGARSVIGPYLATLGASAAVVGIAAGFGELVGYVIRLVSGYVADQTRRYWAVTIFGYLLNLFAVPLLALAGSWQIAVALIIAERMGRALRTPTRDAMLSHVAAHTGAGWAFGLHEALDTTWAVIGPLAVSAALYWHEGYPFGFAMLIVPALLSIGVLLMARRQFPAPHHLEVAKPIGAPDTLSRKFWVYAFAAAFVGAGYADFSLIAYHLGRTMIVAPPWIPILYALAMVAAAMSALSLGRLYDQAGIVVMIPATLISALSAPLAFLGGPWLVLLGVLAWGVGMGAQESVMRAVIACLAPADRRATAFGLFHAIFGVAWFAGSAALGLLYDRSVASMAALSFILQILPIPILFALVLQTRTFRAP